jgi:hypothetical protein
MASTTETAKVPVVGQFCGKHWIAVPIVFFSLGLLLGLFCTYSTQDMMRSYEAGYSGGVKDATGVTSGRQNDLKYAPKWEAQGQKWDPVKVMLEEAGAKEVKK